MSLVDLATRTEGFVCKGFHFSKILFIRKEFARFILSVFDDTEGEIRTN